MSIERDGRGVQCGSAKSLELLAFLLLHRGRAQSREKLSGLLWPEEPEATAKRYLRQALWRLNAALAGEPERAGAADDLISTTPGWLTLSATAVTWLDVGVFEEAERAVRDIPGHALTDAQADHLERALSVYRGEFLTGWDQEWCRHERLRLHERHLGMLEQLMGFCESRRRFAQGLSLGQRILSEDPARESTHRLLIRLHFRAGDRTAAIRQFQLCDEALSSEFDIAPSAATRALHQQVLLDRPVDIPHQPAPPGQPLLDVLDLRADPLLALNLRLEQIQTTLNTLLRIVGAETGRAG